MPPLLTQMKRVFFQTSVQLMCSGRMLNGCCTQPQPHITCHVITQMEVVELHQTVETQRQGTDRASVGRVGLLTAFGEPRMLALL